MSGSLKNDSLRGDRSTPRRKGLLKDQLELDKFLTKDGRVRYTIKPIADQLSFDKGFFVFIRAVQLLMSQNEGTIVVGLAGPSGSGKTAFSKKVKSFMQGVAVISMDNYNDGSKVVDGNFDDPRLTDYDLLLQNIQDLKDGKEVKIPIYDFKQSKRVGYSDMAVPSSRVVIVEGIYALSDKLRDLLDLKVSITGGVHFDLVKRVLRDLDRSGQAADEIITQISDTVYPMYKAFIEPDLMTAHLRIYNTFNPFTGFMNATYILKAQQDVRIEDAEKVLEGSSRTNESDIVDIYLLPPNEDPETCTSWLRMRNRDGRYSLMFEECVTEGPFIISPRISFEVSVRILGGLMALGYEIGTIVKRKTVTIASKAVVIKFDDIDKLGSFVQLQGKDRDKLAAVGRELGLEGHYLPRSYIEQVQLEKLTNELRANVDLKKHFGLHDDVLLSAKRSLSFAADDFPSASSLPARLSSSASLPIPITVSTSPNGMTSQRTSGGGSSSNGGLLTQKMRATRSETEEGDYQQLAQSMKRSQANVHSQSSEFTTSIRDLCDRMDRITSSWSGESLRDMGRQITQLHGQCQNLNKSVEDLAQVVEKLAGDLSKIASFSGKDGSSALVQVGLLGIGLGAVVGWMLACGKSRV
ncbi:hypothetical protein BSKO_05978 [Bryopsis sp. KO-2023]|nr:hypothetical protein BSKO_05978 [Bryopsis sp. KO-2023]